MTWDILFIDCFHAMTAGFNHHLSKYTSHHTLSTDQQHMQYNREKKIYKLHKIKLTWKSEG